VSARKSVGASEVYHNGISVDERNSGLWLNVGNATRFAAQLGKDQ
jgi:hypothetical protein